MYVLQLLVYKARKVIMIRKGINTSGRKSCLVQRHKKWKEHLGRGADDASSRYLEKQNDEAQYRRRVKDQLRAAELQAGRNEEVHVEVDEVILGDDDDLDSFPTVAADNVLDEEAHKDDPAVTDALKTIDSSDAEINSNNAPDTTIVVPEWKRHKQFLAELFYDDIVCVRHQGEELFKNKSAMQAYQRRKVTADEWNSNVRMLHALRVSREEGK